MLRTRIVLFCLVAAFGVAARRPVGWLVALEGSDRSLVNCYHTDEGAIQGELRLRADGATLQAILIATRGDFYAPGNQKLQWAGTGRRVRNRVELVLDRTVYGPTVPQRVFYNADVQNKRVHGLVFEPGYDPDGLLETLVMDGCYRAGYVDVPSTGD